MKALAASESIQSRRSSRARAHRRRVPVIVAAAATMAVVIVAIAALSGVFASNAARLPEPSGPAVGPTNIVGGPGGRVALARWLLRRDRGDTGLAAHWERGAFAGSPVTVPYAVNTTPITGPGAVANYNGSVAWYRTSFLIPRTGPYVLHFESANFLATAWLDGHRLGSHIGSYLPFDFRVAPTRGRHVLVVRTDWRDPAAQSTQGFHRTWFNFGGLDGEVSIWPVGASELSAPFLQTKLSPVSGGAPEALVNVSVQVRNDGTPRMITPQGSLDHGGQSTGLSFGATFIGHGRSAVVTAATAISDPALWSPASPNLYDLNLSVPGESSYHAKVGLRQLRWSGGRLTLNGRRVVLHGASIQEDVQGRGDALRPADQDALVADLKSIGANATRSQHPLDPGLLERLDAAGILVWEGVGPVDSSGNWTSDTPELMHQAQRRVRISVAAAQLHPSIIVWNLANEIAGQGHRGGQAQYVEQATAWLHANDPGRPVAVDIWGEHPPRASGPIYRHLDAIAETNYAGWYDDPGGSPASVARLISARLAHLRALFADKVVIISEFGGEANALNPSQSLGGYAYQARLEAEHIRQYEADPALSGMLVWDLRDFAVAPSFAGGSIHRVDPAIRLVKGLDQKGLLDYAGRPKPAAAVVRRAFAALGPF